MHFFLLLMMDIDNCFSSLFVYFIFFFFALLEFNLLTSFFFTFSHIDFLSHVYDIHPFFSIYTNDAYVWQFFYYYYYWWSYPAKRKINVSPSSTLIHNLIRTDIIREEIRRFFFYFVIARFNYYIELFVSMIWRKR